MLSAFGQWWFLTAITLRNMNHFIKEPFKERSVLGSFFAALLGIIIISLAYYPGLMSADSIVQLAIARNANYGEWHPPIMSLVWRYLDHLIPGPFPMMLFHNLMFWSGLALLNHTLFRSMWAKIFGVLVFGLYPAYLALLGTVWKDVGMGCSYVLFVALTLRGREKGAPWDFVGALMCLFYGTAVRHNALSALFPLLFWWAWCLPKRINRFSASPYSLLQRIGVAVSIALVFNLSFIVGDKVLQNTLVVKKNTYYINPNLQAVLLFDLSAISVRTGKITMPPFELASRPNLTLNDIRDRYFPSSVNPLLSLTFTADNSPHFQFTNDATEASELKSLWFQTMINNPRAYLSHRWHVFKSLIGLTGDPVCYPYHGGVDPNSLGVSFHAGRVNHWVTKILARVNNTLMFRGWFYVAVIPVIILLVVGLGRSEKVAIICLGASGLLYLGPYFFIAGSCDFRYYWWTVVAVGLMVMFLLSSRPVFPRAKN
jgi:hypothetical protein